MTIEQSHGKARPTLPRLADVRALPPAAEPNRDRGAGGRFAAGNGVGRGRHWRHVLRKQLGREVEGPLAAEVESLASEAYSLAKAFLAELPSDGPGVRALVVARARATVMAARFAHRAWELGPDTLEGAKATETSLKYDQRAERLAVTSLDIATRLARRKPDGGDAPWLLDVEVASK